MVSTAKSIQIQFPQPFGNHVSPFRPGADYFKGDAGRPTGTIQVTGLVFFWIGCQEGIGKKTVLLLGQNRKLFQFFDITNLVWIELAGVHPLPVELKMFVGMNQEFSEFLQLQNFDSVLVKWISMHQAA
jgi:hypothetical protein